MGVSVTGQHGISARSIRSFLVVVAIFTGFTTYFYGPAITPGIRAAAAEACNEHAGGNFRSYRLSWESGPGSTPHWSCRDARRPAEPAVDLGWWVSPTR